MPQRLNRIFLSSSTGNVTRVEVPKEFTNTAKLPFTQCVPLEHIFYT